MALGTHILNRHKEAHYQHYAGSGLLVNRARRS